MGIFAVIISVVSYLLEAHLLFRARHEAILGRFPFFYSYLLFVLLWSMAASVIYYFMPRYYAKWFWFSFLGMLLAEFAVLLESSDHIFQPYPLIRRLGRLLTASVCLIFFLTLVLPTLLEHRPRSLALFELTRTAAFTKAVLILVLLGAARLYDLPLGRNTSGMLVGFAAYLAVTVANVTLAEMYGRTFYRGVFTVVGPLGFVLGLSIWNVALWRCEPVAPATSAARESGNTVSGLGGAGLGKYHTELMRLFRR